MKGENVFGHLSSGRAIHVDPEHPSHPSRDGGSFEQRFERFLAKRFERLYRARGPLLLPRLGAVTAINVVFVPLAREVVQISFLLQLVLLGLVMTIELYLAYVAFLVLIVIERGRDAHALDRIFSWIAPFLSLSAVVPTFVFLCPGRGNWIGYATGETVAAVLLNVTVETGFLLSLVAILKLHRDGYPFWDRWKALCYGSLAIYLMLAFLVPLNILLDNLDSR